MTWSSSPNPTIWDRLLAALPYILPVMSGLPYGDQLVSQFPVFGFLLLPLAPLIFVYSMLQSIPLIGSFFGLIVFFALILLVVRNENISRFIRFNTMQAILLSFILAVCGLILSLLDPSVFGSLLFSTLANVLFLGMLISVGFSLVQTFRGLYAEIPTISEAVHMQVR
ncbi:Tic20 family protein [Leptolyngbya sp. CCNP1308]|uniref:Tic20 family protein n=1 Tax=Leptolyngbya sp. CCNP1308 TaxID=3110255 RepID=UPI002B1FB703|nr:Tic20 family protein [Leptolyngbya sp. CCNP1308]MEA5448987.1 Tic20 family protein [Leptolyngbya sp. CCNP1308]